MDLRSVHDTLLAAHGPQGWWPARTRFEMALGAILVQNTRWSNASRALERLDRAGWLSPAALAGAPLEEVAKAVRPAGFWRSKAPRLRGFAAWLQSAGGFEQLGRRPTAELRGALLGVAGIGPETADCLLVYAFGRPVFIASAYARRLVERLGLPGSEELTGSYEGLRLWAEERLPDDASFMNEFHALIVRHCKEVCTAGSPGCEVCVLAGRCRTGREITGRRSSGR